MNSKKGLFAKMFGSKEAAKMFSVGNTKDGLSIDLYGYVGDYWDANEAADLLNILNRNRNATNINLNVHSYGGYVTEGLAILNQLKEHAAQVTATVQGTAASMASVIIMGADKIRVHKASWIMIHEAETNTAGRASDLEHDADFLRNMNNQIANIYQERTGLPIEKIEEMMTAETWMTGEQAVELGFADELIDIQSAQKTTSAQMRAIACEPLLFSSLDVYKNVPLNCLDKEQAERLSARITAPIVDGPNNQILTESNTVSNQPAKSTPDQIVAAQNIIAAATNAPTQEQIDAANVVMSGVKPEVLQVKPEITNTTIQTNSDQPDVTAAATEIAQLCNLAGKPQKIAAFLTANKTPSEVRAELSVEKNAELAAIPNVNSQLNDDLVSDDRPSVAEEAQALVNKQKKI